VNEQMAGGGLRLRWHGAGSCGTYVNAVDFSCGTRVIAMAWGVLCRNKGYA